METIEKFRATQGVTQVIGMIEAYVTKPGKYAPPDDIQPTTSFNVGDCATLREVARIDSCEDGDTFVVHPPRNDKEMTDWMDKTARKGKEVEFESGSGRKLRWTLPADAKTVVSRKDPTGEDHWGGIMVTPPGAVDATTLPGASTVSQIRIDESVPDAAEYVRNTAARIDPACAWSP